MSNIMATNEALEIVKTNLDERLHIDLERMMSGDNQSDEALMYRGKVMLSFINGVDKACANTIKLKTYPKADAHFEKISTACRRVMAEIIIANDSFGYAQKYQVNS